MGTPQASPSDHDDSRRRPSSADERILLVDLLLTLSRGRGLIVLSILAFGLLGVLYAVSLPAEYTAT